MRKVAIAFIVIGIIILVMSSIRITIPIITSPPLPGISKIVNVTPGMELVVNDINGSLTLTPIKGYSQFLDSIDYLSPILVFVGIVISMVILVRGRNVKFSISDPLIFGVMLMLTFSLIFALPIPTPIYLDGNPTSTYLLVGVNAYVGLSSTMYLISAALLTVSTWLYRETQTIESLYPDIDQLMSMTVMLKSEEETEESG